MGEYFCDTCKFYDDDVSFKFDCFCICFVPFIPTDACCFFYRQRKGSTIAMIVAYAGEHNRNFHQYINY